MLPEYFEFSLPVKLVYGAGIIDNIKDAVARFGKRRALLVTDAILAEAGPVEKVKNGFKNTNISIVSVFDDVPPNSTLKTVQDCAAQGNENNCDMVIAVGGGSVIDTAKVANLLMVKGGNIEDHMGAYLLDTSEELFPSIIIPTTAGTGSEVTKVAVIADPENDVKLPFSEEQFLPKLAILDPEMTLSLPGKLTASTGMDALVHAIEAYVDKEWSPASDALALHAIKLISRNILVACANPQDIEARGAMLVGSFLAGVAFSHSMVGMVHGISHALGGVYHIPHGLANALILPEVMEHNLESRLDRFADIAFTLGISFPEVVTDSQSIIKTGKLDLLSKLARKTELSALQEVIDNGSTVVKDFALRQLDSLQFVDQWIRRKAAESGIEKIRTLNRQLAFLTGIPLNLRDAGIKDDLAKLDKVADTAMEDGSMLYNPVEPKREDVIKIVRKAYESKEKPLKVSENDLRAAKAGTVGDKKSMKGVFKDTAQLYDILVGFYELLKKDGELGPALAKTGLCVQFVYQNPSAVITVDATGDEVQIIQGDFNGKPEVTMTMDADFAHKFWHGKANLVSALTRRLVVAKGNVPKTLKLLPVLKPAYKLYPKYLKEKGFSDLIM
ncbi:NAD-dependent methanol dehydrogenase (modular protein) [Desulfamplus magnetovallimortis]|uniref:NAD-dependent methanol dehydrogenase (Modular protein) n=1 Tax=Desulfamplus magnetovallimortis TaxID=1246637 RepID=A0A1W1HCM4_9BACT|nr:iron-containing alcohol dehydrogenase [Desulfamplus magnetovallimortis]SLM30209.1 NAD-dependent methanol dehydrogenase (modular protein) [Desulfamplus magnetovallimortis]